MSVATSDDLARVWADRIERSEARRHGVSLATARKRVADRLGIAPGTLENLSRDRLKGVRQWLFEALKAGVIAEIRREIAAHEHELVALAADPRGDAGGQVAEVLSSLDALRSRLNEVAPSKRRRA